MHKQNRLKIFLCYSKDDRSKIRELYLHLTVDGFDVWLDEENLFAGQEWELEIRRAVRESDVVIVFISKSSTVKEGFVQKEIRYALAVADEKPEGTIYIIPARLEDCQPPSRFSKWQWVDLFTSNGYEKLKKSLEHRKSLLNRSDLETELVSPRRIPRVVVHREEQWILIDSEIRKRFSEPVLPRCVINIFGAAGIGKSTFIRETLYPRLRKNYNFMPIARIDFDRDFVDQKYDTQLRGNILIDLISELEKSSNVSANIESIKHKWESRRSSHNLRKQKLQQYENELVSAFLNFVSFLSSEHGKLPVLLILDTMEHADHQVIEWIQEKLQAATTESGYVIWIMASRQPIDCQPFFLRPRYFWLPFEAFNEQQIQEQIYDHPKFAEVVKRFSFGLPSATSKIMSTIREIEEEKQRILDVSELENEEVLKRLILSLEDMLKLKHYFGQLESTYLSQALEILSPLRTFNVGVVTELLPKWLPEYFKPTTIGADALYEIQKMVQTRLVQWDRSRRAYAIDEPIRQIVALILRLKYPEKFLAIQKWAAEYYISWAKNVEARRSDYLVEALYHELIVLLLEYDPDPVGKLTSYIDWIINGYYIDNILGVEEMFAAIKEQLEIDQDFNALLNPNEMERILVHLQNWLGNGV